MTNKTYLIGNKEDYSSYLSNPNDIDFLPIKNLPLTYFPFYYNKSETSKEKISRLVPILEDYFGKNTGITNSVYGSDGKSENVNLDKLFTILTNIEQPYQPFNNNNIYHIRIVIIIFWIFIGFYILKVLYNNFPEKYTYIIGISIVLLLIMGLTWALVITSQGY